MLTCLYRAAFSPSEIKSLIGREAGLVTGVGHSNGRWVIWTFIPGSALALVLQILRNEVKTLRNEVQGLLLHVYAARSVVAPPEHLWHSKEC